MSLINFAQTVSSILIASKFVRIGSLFFLTLGFGYNLKPAFVIWKFICGFQNLPDKGVHGKIRNLWNWITYAWFSVASCRRFWSRSDQIEKLHELYAVISFSLILQKSVKSLRNRFSKTYPSKCLFHHLRELVKKLACRHKLEHTYRENYDYFHCSNF